MKIALLHTLLISVIAGVTNAEPVAKGDRVLVVVTGESISEAEIAKINAVYPVSINGTINMPFIGAFRAAGVEPALLAHQLARAYKEAEIYERSKFEVRIEGAQEEKE